MTMKNFAGNVAKNLRNNLIKNSFKSQMLKWAKEGGGGSM
jgi:hypothetical protein